ncbi:MAG: UvrD-helicase domain-containing protein, partial [Acidiferrobacterales bacterium]
MSDINNATHPETNFVVHAAAGTGKTWLLTSRIIRLLLSGAQPGGILAITFTRKAAAEIEQRVMQRLFDMAICTPSTLKKNLLEIGCEPSITSMDGARFLYESLLVAEHPLKVTTFHAFCQDLLQRFPLESGLAPGFRIVENTRQLQERAWQIFESSLRRPDYKAVHSSFETLLHLTGSPVMARNALLDFLEQRSDWWSYVEGELKPVNFAKKQFDKLMNTNTESDSDGTISLNTLRKNIYRYRELLLTNATKTIADRLQQIQHNALATESDFVA